MPFAFTQDVPITWEVYQRIRSGLDAALGGRPPPGLIVHVVMETEKGLRYLDVWESREAHRSFVETTLHAVVDRALSGAGMARRAEPETHLVSVREVWVGSSAAG